MNQPNSVIAKNTSAVFAADEKNDHASLVFWLIAASVLSGIMVNFSAELQQYLMLIMVPPLVFGYLGILAYALFFTNKQQEVRLLIIWFFAGVYLIVCGLLRWNLFSDDKFVSIFINQDLRYFMYAGCGIILSNPCFRNRLIRLVRFVGLLSAVFGVLALMNLNLDLAVIRSRLQAWSLPYYFWWLSVSVFALNYALTRMTGRSRLAGLGALLAYVICGALFLKRAAIVNTALLFAICELLAAKASEKWGALRRIAAAAVCLALLAAVIWLLAASVPLISDLIGSFQTRLAQAGDTYDRMFEVNQYLQQASAADLIFGKGFGNYAYLTSMYTGRNYLANALHIGYLDILYVGGIPYCVLWLIIVVGVVKRLRLINSMDAYEKACLAAAVLMLGSLLFELSRGNLISPVFQFTAISTVLCVERNSRKGETYESLLQRETDL